MNKPLRHAFSSGTSFGTFLVTLATFLAGLAVVAWVGAGYLGASPLALGITALIGAVYLVGMLELRRFRQATAALAVAVESLAEPPPTLQPWLARVPAALQNAVRRRIEGEPVGLPGPALAPTLAGLLVLLGMLGTFLGMVLTLRGTGAALDSATDLLAVRNSLVAPVKGLGLAFGTSVAGVAASAALGLLAALCRRERAQVAQRLDGRIATSLRVFSVAHQRETSLALAQRQAELMPALVDGLRAMMGALERQAEASNAGLLASQERFHTRAEAAYAGLAASVDRTLQTSLAQSARSAGETLQALAANSLAGIGRETSALHTSLATTMQTQLDQLAARVEASAATVAGSWQQAHAGLAAALAAGEQQRVAAMAALLDAMAASLQREWQAAGAQALAQQQRVCEAMERSARDTATEIARLLALAAQAPQAAAEVIAELRQQLSDSLAHDNALLDERARILGSLDRLLDGVNQAATEQRGAIDALLASSAATMARAGTHLAEQAAAETAQLGEVAAQVGASAVELASLGESFGFAVQLFSESNEKLGAHLQRVDTALGASMARSDEQLAYYVAQAREVIDLSLLSQKQIIEDLQRLAARAAPAEALAR